MRALLIFCAIFYCYSLEFTWLEGKRADPCARTTTSSFPDCPTNSQLPDSAVTVLIPSASSKPNRVTPISRDGTLFSHVFRLMGKGLPLPTSPGAQPTSYLWLGQHGSCSSGSVIPGSRIDATSRQDWFGEYLEFRIPNPCNTSAIGWCSDTFEVLDDPLTLCYSTSPNLPVQAVYTGFKIGVVLNCDTDTSVPQAALCTPTELSDSRPRWQSLVPLTPLQLESRVQRPLCCKGSMINTLKTGQCINPNLQGCCGGTAYALTAEKCCSPKYGWVVSIDQDCPCSTTVDCPVGEQCCLTTKYPELNTTEDCPTIFTSIPAPSCLKGRCFNPEQKRCCDTGAVYDYGVDQCCPINGVQSLNVPCPCSDNSHCSPLSAEHMCCKQTGPNNYYEAEACSKYQNYPSGTGTYEVQRCAGFCFDSKYAVCCNGVTCIKEYERCCNTTCCNRFTGTCIEGLRPGARGAPNNPLNYEWFGSTTGAQVFQQCSTIEAVNTVKAFWIWVWPTMLLLVTLAMLSLSIVFSSKATPRKFSILEYLMIFVAIVATGLSCPLFFAPVYKYGMWLVLVQMVVILTASARIRWLNVLCIIVQLVTLIYVFDPFHGNAFFNLSSNRYRRSGSADVVSFAPDPQTSGLLHAIVRSWHTPKLVSQDNYCTNFYDWFKLDPMLRDLDRMDNPEITTFGYCSRGWTNALWFFAGLVMICTILQLILDLLGLFFRFHHDKIELEVHEELVY